MDTSPIVHELTLTCTPDHAFEVFTSRIGEWWDPQYSGNPETFSTVTIDPRMRGQITERHDDGSEHDWGEVIAWDPPAKVAFSFTLAQDRTVLEKPAETTGTAASNAASRRVEVVLLEEKVENITKGEPEGAFASAWDQLKTLIDQGLVKPVEKP